MAIVDSLDRIVQLPYKKNKKFLLRTVGLTLLGKGGFKKIKSKEDL